MKIIKQGKLPEDQEYRVCCGKCKTVFEFKRKEAEYHSDQRDGDFLSIHCPLCGDRKCVAV